MVFVLYLYPYGDVWVSVCVFGLHTHGKGVCVLCDVERMCDI